MVLLARSLAYSLSVRRGRGHGVDHAGDSVFGLVDDDRGHLPPDKLAALLLREVEHARRESIGTRLPAPRASTCSSSRRAPGRGRLAELLPSASARPGRCPAHSSLPRFSSPRPCRRPRPRSARACRGPPSSRTRRTASPSAARCRTLVRAALREERVHKFLGVRPFRDESAGLARGVLGGAGDKCPVRTASAHRCSTVARMYFDYELHTAMACMASLS